MLVAHTQPGFEPVAWSEIAAKVDGAREVIRRSVPNRNGLLVFHAPKSRGLDRLRAVEDLFALVAHRDEISLERTGLEQVLTLSRSARFLTEALEERVRLTPGSRA